MFFAPISHSLQAPLQALSHRLDVDEVRFASQARLHILLEPLIQHVVKIEVGQQGADYLPLTDSSLAPQEPSFIDDPDVDPLCPCGEMSCLGTDGRLSSVDVTYLFYGDS